jgi:hypothetical protein
MIAMAVRHKDQIDLADLAQVLEFRRRERRAHDPGIDHDHLAARRGELEGGLALPQQLGLALGVSGARKREARFLRLLPTVTWFFRAEGVAFP